MKSRIFCFVGTHKCFVSFFVSIVSVFVYDPKKNVWMEFIHFHSIFMEWKWLKATQSDNGIFFYICSNKLRLSFFSCLAVKHLHVIYTNNDQRSDDHVDDDDDGPIM